MIRTTLVIRNELGLHARAAARLVRLAQEFESRIRLGTPSDERMVDGKSILHVLLLAATQGAELVLEVEGLDEVRASQALGTLIEDRFGEGK